MITADTITDAQIRELRDSGRLTPFDWGSCERALGNRPPHAGQSKEQARAHCAYLINVHAKEQSK